MIRLHCLFLFASVICIPRCLYAAEEPNIIIIFVTIWIGQMLAATAIP